MCRLSQISRAPFVERIADQTIAALKFKKRGGGGAEKRLIGHWVGNYHSSEDRNSKYGTSEDISFVTRCGNFPSG